MRIAILGSRGIPAKYGGFETFAQELGIGLTKKGFEVTVFCEGDSENSPSCFEGVDLQYVRTSAPGRLRTIACDLKSLWLARKNFDLVYMLGYGSSIFCFIPRIWGSKVWINMDGLEWSRTKWGTTAKLYLRMMERVALITPNCIIADANAIASNLEQRFGTLPNCSVISYGCHLVERVPSPDHLVEWNLESGAYYLVVCRLEPENNVLEIIEGFKRSSTKKTLVVVGDHLVDNSYVARLRSLESSNVHFIGTVFNPDKLQALRCHAFGYLHGHSVGGTNPSLLEAMGSGNLVFAHDNPFNQETLGGQGFFFTDPESLASAIQDAEMAPGRVMSFRDGAKHRARDKYSWEGVVDEYYDLIQRSVPNRKLSESFLGERKLLN